MRMNMQLQALHTLGGRLHEINSGLSKLLQKHELSISVRAAECRRKHLRLSHQCLGLAAKAQVLRNRGYVMDGPEEELRNKLLLLEKSVLDPALNGRSEEIWARMVSVRERGRLLQREFEKAGRGLSQEQGQLVDEDVMRRVKKVCSTLRPVKSWLANLDKDLGRLQLATRGSDERASAARERLGAVGAVETFGDHQRWREVAFVSACHESSLGLRRHNECTRSRYILRSFENHTWLCHDLTSNVIESDALLTQHHPRHPSSSGHFAIPTERKRSGKLAHNPANHHIPHIEHPQPPLFSSRNTSPARPPETVRSTLCATQTASQLFA